MKIKTYQHGIRPVETSFTSGGAAYTPLSDPTLALWWNSRVINQSAGVVSTWVDQKNGVVLTPTGTTNWTTGLVGGQPGVTGGSLQATGLSGLYANEMHAFIALLETPTPDQIHVQMGVSGSDGWQYWYNASLRSVTAFGFADMPSTNAQGNGVAIVEIALKNGTAPSLVVNTVTQTLTGTTTSFTGNPNKIVIVPGATNPKAEIVVFNTIRSGTALTNIRNYFLSLYGVA